MNSINIAYALNQKQDVLIILRDITGRIIYQTERKNSNNEIVKFNLNEYGQGIYFCTVLTANKTITKKFVLMK